MPGISGFASAHRLTYSLTYLFTPWCRVLLEKLTGLQLVKKFPAFHGTRRLITALTSVRHLSLSWASPIQPIYPHPTSWRSVLILSTHLLLGLPSGLFPSGFPTKTTSDYPPLIIFFEIYFIPLLSVCNLYHSFYRVLLYKSISSVIFYSYKHFWDPKFVHCYLTYLY